MKNIEVVAAVFENDKNEFFCARRRDQGELALKWEFPGGKIEVNETKEQALIREIKEELDTDIEIDNFIMTVQHQYQGFHLTMHAYKTTILKGNLELSEHTDSKWLPKNKMLELDWAAADIPIVIELIK